VKNKEWCVSLLLACVASVGCRGGDTDGDGSEGSLFNQPPRISNLPETASGWTDSGSYFGVLVEDPDDDRFIWEIRDSDCSFEPSVSGGGSVTWGCLEDEQCEVTIQVTDPRGARDAGVLSIVCRETPPEFSTEPPTDAAEGMDYIYEAACEGFEVFDFGVFHVGEQDTCGGEVFDQTPFGEATYRFKPNEEQGGGECTLHMVCVNEVGATRDQLAQISVRETNTEPSLRTSPARRQTRIGHAGSWSFSPSDTDIPAQRLSLAIEAHDCSFEPELEQDGVLSWRCPLEDEQCRVTVSVTDDGSPEGRGDAVLGIACVDDIVPMLEGAEIYPENPLPGERLDCQPIFGEGGGELPAIEYVWTREDGEVVAQTARLQTDKVRDGDTLTCTATVASEQQSFQASVEVRAIEMVKDLGPSDTDVELWQDTFGRLAFFVTEGKEDATLWTTDHTGQNLRELLSLPRSSASSSRGATITPLSARLDTGIFFIVEDHLDSGLWFTDGTVAGTTRLSSYTPEEQQVFIPRGSALAYMVLQDGIHGAEPWASDGTLAGTRLLADVKPGPSSSGARFSSDPEDLFGDEVIFVANDGVHGFEMWRTDGTSQNTSMLFDFAQGAASGVFFPPRVAGPSLLFIGESPMFGGEVHVSDGTLAGTRIVLDIAQGPASGVNRDFLQRVGERFLFYGTNATSGEELWTTDGTVQNTEILVEVTAGSAPGYVSWTSEVEGSDRVLFVAGLGPARRLWSSDGTPQGTAAITGDATTPFAFDKASWKDALFFDGMIYFLVDDDVHGKQIWRSDGTEVGTSMLQWPAPSALPEGYPDDGSPRELVVYNGFLHFTADDGVNGRELWRTDGTASGTALFADVLPGARGSSPEFVAVDDGLVLLASDTLERREIWGSDGVNPGAIMLSAFDGSSQGSDPSDFLVHRGVLYFTAATSARREFFKYDPLGGGSPAVIGSPYEIADAVKPLVFDDEVYLEGNGYDDTQGLYAISGGLLGVPGLSQPLVKSTPSGDVLLFTTYSTFESEVWRSDGTSSGTARIALLDGALWPTLVPVGDRVLLADRFDDSLYVITEQLDRVIALPARASFEQERQDYMRFGDSVLFRNPEDNELWISDGTAAGTVSLLSGVHDFGARPGDYAEHDGVMYFTAGQSAELWRTDGTAAGTERVMTSGDVGSRQIVDMAFLGDLLVFGTARYFGDIAGLHALDLATSEVTTLSSSVIFAPDAALSASVILDDRLVFAALRAKDGGAVGQLWVTDGTSRGTRQVMILEQASDVELPVGVEFVELNDSVYFSFDDGVHGSELWRIE